MNSSSGQASRSPLRVYLAGPAEIEWRMDLLRPEAHGAYAAAVQSGASDATLPNALPYGHTYVGPFQMRPRLNLSELLPKETYEFTRARHLQNPERWRMRHLARADIVFAWIPAAWNNAVNGLPLDFGAELGLAYGTGKAVIVASGSPFGLGMTPLLTEFAWKMIVEETPTKAYERIMADLDVTFERGMARIESRYGGQCAYCRSAYKEGETIFWSKPQGGMHVDCHARWQNEGQDPNTVVFNAELVHALRVENADLEKECLAAMTKNSMLEQEKKALEENLESLQAEFNPEWRR